MTKEERAELRAELLKDKPLGFSKGVVRSLLDALEAKEAEREHLEEGARLLRICAAESDDSALDWPALAAWMRIDRGTP